MTTGYSPYPFSDRMPMLVGECRVSIKDYEIFRSPHRRTVSTGKNVDRSH